MQVFYIGFESFKYQRSIGIGLGGYMDWLPLRVYRQVLEVNFFGIVAITQAFLQHLKKTRGSRVINLSSMAGLFGGPGFGPYSASKHAVEGLAKSLKEELRPWGVGR
jgi:NAD(P)-dependent dehydrogenase (short-subunit alcohol dehydrogenase family)